MDGFISIITAVIGFGILVFFHELGHFIMAKIFKIKVEVFSLGWGPKLFGFKGKETTYQIAVFPIGGFCKFKGDEMTDKMENLTKDPDSFYGAKPYKRLFVALCGPLMNYLIAIIFLAILAMGSYKEFYMPNKVLLVDDIKTDTEVSPAKRAGIISGDEIIKINNKSIASYDELTKYMVLKGNRKELNVLLKRDGNLINVKINPQWDPEQLKAIIGVYYYLKPIIKFNDSPLLRYIGLEDKDEIIGIDDDYSNITDIKVNSYLDNNFSTNKVGILHIKRKENTIDKTIIFNEINYQVSKKDFYLPFYYPQREVKGVNPIKALIKGFENSNEIIILSAIGLHSLIFKPKKNVQNQLGGPIRIGYYIGMTTIDGFKDSLYMGFRNFLSIISYISLALAFFNLLPLPAVDGGHIVLNLYEIITRKTISLKVIYIINMIGFLLLISLAIIIAYFDIFNISNIGK